MNLKAPTCRERVVGSEESVVVELEAEQLEGSQGDFGCRSPAVRSVESPQNATIATARAKDRRERTTAERIAGALPAEAMRSVVETQFIVRRYLGG